MPKILSVLILVLMISLLIPTGLVLASQNAIPGDATYPLKRTLERVILTLVSLHPTSRTFFHVDLMNRRFKEAQILLAKGQKVTEALSELVNQTDTAANNAIEISNKSQKAKLINELTKDIAEFDKQLVKHTFPQLTISPTPTPQVTAMPSPESIVCTQDAKQCPDGSSVGRVPPACEFAPCPIATLRPTPAPSPTTMAIPRVTLQPIPTARPTPSPSASPALTADQIKEIEEARKRLAEIRRRLEQERRTSERRGSLHRDSDSEDKQRGKETLQNERNDKDKKSNKGERD